MEASAETLRQQIKDTKLCCKRNHTRALAKGKWPRTVWRVKLPIPIESKGALGRRVRTEDCWFRTAGARCKRMFPLFPSPCTPSQGGQEPPWQVCWARKRKKGTSPPLPRQTWLQPAPPSSTPAETERLDYSQGYESTHSDLDVKMTLQLCISPEHPGKSGDVSSRCTGQWGGGVKAALWLHPRNLWVSASTF